MLCSLVIAVQILITLPASARQVSTDRGYSLPVGTFLGFFQEQGVPVSPQEALASDFQPSNRTVLSYGIGADPVWLKLEVSNNSSDAQLRHLLFETSWLDVIDVYWFRDGELQAQDGAGDRAARLPRNDAGRHPVFNHAYAPGLTTVLLRVESIDPMNLPLYFLSPTEVTSKTMLQSYSYGLLYGAVLSLLLYNLMLFTGLKEKRYLFFAIYLASFLAMNMAYTGHGLKYFWPNFLYWQQFANPLLMSVYNVAGLAFALCFLEVKNTFPRTYRMTVMLCGLVIGLQLIAIVAGFQHGSLMLAFALMLVFSSLMFALGFISWRGGNPWAKYFLFASIAGALGSTATACAVLGLIPFSTLAYRAIDVGITLDIVLLAFALADQYRVSEKAKIRAEALARIDYLTGLNNRRAFYEQTDPLWHVGRRHGREMSLILLDLDHFKSINDQYGHGVGDEALIRVAQVLQDRVRASDISGRWGGEEFIIFLPETALAGAVSLAETIRADISAIKWPVEYPQLRLSASFGVAQSSTDHAALEDVIHLADKRLYTAKDHGRDRVGSAGALVLDTPR